MKIIFLNALEAELRDPMTEYIKNASKDTEVFCFQEAGKIATSLFRQILPEWKEIATHKDLSYDIRNLAIYIKGASIISSENLFDGEEHLGAGIYAQLPLENSALHIGNFHGVAYPTDDKLDNPERIMRSKELIEFFKQKEGPKIIGGDFNMLPEAESIRMFEENGYIDLIKKFKIKTTRNRIAWEKHLTKMYYSDYVFVSPDVKIKSFAVPDIEISDHLPMELEIEI